MYKLYCRVCKKALTRKSKKDQYHLCKEIDAMVKLQSDNPKLKTGVSPRASKPIPRKRKQSNR